MKTLIILKIGAITLSLSLILVGFVGASGTGAWFSDNETSNGNILTAGELDLTVDGVNTNVLKFEVDPFVPGYQPNVTYILKNEGNIPGYLDLQSIVVTDLENVITEPESTAGDATDPGGELSGLTNIRIMNDVNGDGWLQTGDTVIYEGLIKDLASAYENNLLIPAGGTTNLNILINWWSNANDNLAQTDSTTIDMTFELGQTTGQ